MNANNKQNHEIDRVKNALKVQKKICIDLWRKIRIVNRLNRILVPVGNRVIVKPYEKKNPYSMQSTSGQF